MAQQRKSPDTKALEDMIEQLESDYEKAEDGSISITVSETEDILEVLKWTCEKLNTQKIYHKTQNRKKKIIERLIKEQLSADELRQIDIEARKAVEAEVE
jgi:hypothetical protein